MKIPHRAIGLAAATLAFVCLLSGSSIFQARFGSLETYVKVETTPVAALLWLPPAVTAIESLCIPCPDASLKEAKWYLVLFALLTDFL